MSQYNLSSDLVVGAGAALVDLILEESDDFLKQMGSEKGGMTLVEKEHIESSLSNSSNQAKVVPGGSACNTLVGVSKLGGKAHMVGRCGEDSFFEIFKKGMDASGVKTSLANSDTSTGRVLSVVTPDAQRTMFTFLGAAAMLSADDIVEEDFAKAGIIHLEGYLLFNQPVVEKILDIKRNSKAKLSLDLASFEVVNATRDYVNQIIPEHVDILIANEDEAKAFTGKEEEEALTQLKDLAEIAVVKLGARGALISHNGKTHVTEANKVKALDTTGAGDLWAAGFLYGLTQDMNIANAANLGAKVASEVVQVMGASIPESGWESIHSYKAQLA